MAVTSAGYDGTVFEADWSSLFSRAGHAPTVSDAGSWLVTAVPAQDRKVRVAVGSGAGYGVFDTVTAAIDITLPTVTAARWSTIVCRRNWTTNTTSFVALTSTSTQVLGALESDPGTGMNDTALALVRVSPGVQVPDRVVDLRHTITNARQGWDDWTAISLQIGVSNDSAHGHSLAYRTSIPTGQIEIRGAVSADDGAFSAGLSADAGIGAPLPDEAWPNRRQYHVGACEFNSSTNPSASARHWIDTAGQIWYVAPTGPAWMSFDGWVYDLG